MVSLTVLTTLNTHQGDLFKCSGSRYKYIEPVFRVNGLVCMYKLHGEVTWVICMAIHVHVQVFRKFGSSPLPPLVFDHF